jgi:DNA repair exonuclease SbcCD ATPase subunit
MAQVNEQRGSAFVRALSIAFLGKLNLFVGGLGAAVAYSMNSLPVLVGAAVAYGALVVRDLSKAQTWKRARREVNDPRALSELPEPAQLFDPALQRAARQLAQAQHDLARERRAGGSMAAYLDLALGNAGQLDAGAARLVNRGDALFRYLRSQSQERVQSEIKDLDAKARKAQDAAAREQYLAAKAAREQHLSTLQQLSEALERIHANVARIVATAEALPARVVHMRALDGQAVDAMSGNVNQELDRLSHEVAEFEETLKTESVRVPE